MKTLTTWRNWFIAFSILFASYSVIMKCIDPQYINLLGRRDFLTALVLMLTAFILNIVKAALKEELGKREQVDNLFVENNAQGENADA